ncbi:dihydrolipoyl dehydrogenase family protein [Streptomyces sp. NPDC127069]|uniref:dihydrolipoyl dehydrogenase family protein n=1 Tax=Streptomyces sp. NPDC127069 TaxID=3347128 RepID=UPI00364EC3BD
MSTSYDYDVVILGSGPGGCAAALHTARLGLKTAVIEEKDWGGVSANTGSIPSNALLRSAEVVSFVQNEAKAFGVRVDGTVSFNFSEAFDRSRKLASQAAADIGSRLKSSNVAQIKGRGTFRDDHTIDVALSAGGTRSITFANCVIAVGAEPRLVKEVPLSARVVTCEQQILSETLPSSIVIIGGGSRGVEFASMLHGFGVKVTIIEHLDALLPLADADVSTELIRSFNQRGINVQRCTDVVSVDDSGPNVRVTVVDGADSEQRSPRVLEAERVLLAVGSQPRVTGYGLEKIGASLKPSGGIKVNEKCQILDNDETAISHIFAVGDVTGEQTYESVASGMGVAAASYVVGFVASHQPIQVEPYRIPKVTHCQPQVAGFGLTEKQARALYSDGCLVKTVPFSANGKARCLGDITGFVKIICTKDQGEILGAHVVGTGAAELVAKLALAYASENSVGEVAASAHAMPSLGEAVQEAASNLFQAMNRTK